MLQSRDGLDRARLVKLFRYARMPLDLSQQEAEVMASIVPAKRRSGGRGKAVYLH